MLEIKDLHVNYGAVHALNGVSMTVNDGEIVSLIGANGAGKTTTLRTITGLEKAVSGSITFDGHDLRKTEPSKIITLKLAHVPEGRHVFPELSVYENLVAGAIPCKKLPRAELQNRIEQQFELFPRLKERSSQMAGTMSGGEQQMLAISRGLMSNPKLLMLDEPSLGLAPIIVEEIFNMIEKVRKAGTTVLLIEQNASIALQISDYAYAIELGRISLSGTGQELLNSEDVKRVYLGM
mgnify:CR=1 FL=1